MLDVFFNALVPNPVRTLGKALSDASKEWQRGHIHLRGYLDLGPRDYILNEKLLTLRDPHEGRYEWPAEAVFRIDEIDPPAASEGLHDESSSEDDEAESGLPSPDEIARFSLQMAHTAMADLHNVLADGFTNRSPNAINALGVAAAEQECNLSSPNFDRVRAILSMTTRCAARARYRDRW
jgi:hypothetical protein